MATPGSNLLNKALRLISAQSMTYLAFVDRTRVSTGLLVPNYDDPATIRGSIQPVSRQLMQMLGLDMQRHYVNIFVSQAVIDVDRDVSSDKFIFAGETYQALSITKWVSVDGWNQVLAVGIPSDA